MKQENLGYMNLFPKGGLFKVGGGFRKEDNGRRSLPCYSGGKNSLSGCR